MYSERWSPGLRQGDIIGQVRFPLAKTRFQWVGSGGGLSATTTSEPTQAVVDVSPRYVMVLSHDCEFNEEKRTHFLVARIDSLSTKLPPEELEELRLGNDVEAAAAEGKRIALDSFIVDPLPDVFDNHRRVNFTAVASYPMTYRDEAQRMKKAELEHGVRLLLRAKVGYFFARDPKVEDVPDADKATPEEVLQRLAESETEASS